ncbi:MAG TPA: NAD(P)-binding protein, partial [Bacteroidia bacterium]|nr:NAD(P)-binding protein [Bacteroidia bacterium]
MKNNILIIGSGISGLAAALLLSKRGYGKDIIIIEKGTAVGGLLKKYDYGTEHGVFDYGMHNFLETGIKELDDLIFDLLPKTDWQILEGKNRDLAGLFYNGVLQKNTPFFDIRNLGEKEYGECLANLFSHLNTDLNVTENQITTALDFAIKRFGEKVASKTIIPSVEKIHKMPAEELDYMATLFTPMSRIAFADEVLVTELTKSDKLKELIAWSDQRTLPLNRSSGRKAYYPIKYGAYRVVDAIIKQLKESGVTIMTESTLSNITIKDNAIDTIEVKNGLKNEIFYCPKSVLWTGGIPPLGQALKTDFTILKFDKPLKTIIVNILLNKQLNIGDLYYFFCYDNCFNTYRLTNYINYSQGAIRNGLYPVCIELLVKEQDLL